MANTITKPVTWIFLVLNILYVLSCKKSEFQCGQSESCVPSTWRCDGEPDCPDGSDEAMCGEPTCSEFQCDDNACIPNRWLCDGENDCSGGADEKNCNEEYSSHDIKASSTIGVETYTTSMTEASESWSPHHLTSCKPTDFQCDNSDCIPASWRCDLKSDCRDDSDERNCGFPTAPVGSHNIHHLTSCKPTDFQCDNSDCIPASWRCDKKSDCRDDSDERNCGFPTAPVHHGNRIHLTSCKPTDFQCDNSDCIPASWRCDHDRDCRDDSDEKYCDYYRSQYSGQLRPTPSHNVQMTMRESVVDSIKLMPSTVMTMQDSLFTATPSSMVKTDGCSSADFRCASGQCIPKVWHCDGDAECHDGSDEVDCRRCKDDGFQCANGEKCILKFWLCDGDTNCSDGSDEIGCGDVSVKKTELTTSSNIMIEAGWTCKSDDYRCSDGQCIPLPWRCDGEPDCNDGSDEINCMTPTKPHTTTHQPCEHTCPDGKCIKTQWLCDGDLDCIDGSDEAPETCGNEINTCSKEQTRCKDGTCIPVRWKCDGEADCADHSDEDDCPAKTGFQSSTEAPDCQPDQFSCDWGRCLNKRLLCDGIRHCDDHTDERVAICQQERHDISTTILPSESSSFYLPMSSTYFFISSSTATTTSTPTVDTMVTIDTRTIPSLSTTCKTNEFACEGGVCIDISWVCDGDTDCPDGSDEDDTTCLNEVNSCPDGEVECADGSCYKKEWQCDLELDCPDGSDEDPKLCGYSMPPKSNNVSLPPTSKPRGQRPCGDDEVSCDDGGCVSRNLTCDGVKHCQDGSDEDADLCTDTEVILLSKQEYPALSVLDLDGRQVKDVVNGEDNSTRYDMFQLDTRRRIMYWQDTPSSSIYTGYITKDFELQYSRKLVEVPNLKNFAVDWVHQNLFWTVSTDTTIRVLSVLTRVNTTLLDTSFSVIVAIGLDPRNGWVYWLGWDKTGVKVDRCGMDGSRRQTIIKGVVTWPEEMTIDYQQELLYLHDKWPERIFSCDLEGTECKVIFPESKFKSSLDVYKNQLYWIDDGHRVQMAARNDTGSVRTISTSQSDNRYTRLRIFAKDRQHKVHNRCGSINAWCEICLPTPPASNGYKCACPDHLYLQPDRTCGETNPNVPTCEKGYIADAGDCVDIDECSLDTHTCSHQCLNTPGGYTCKCHPGFLPVNGTGCIVDGSKAVMLVTQGPWIKRVNLTTGYSRMLRLSYSSLTMRRPVSLAVDIQRSTVFWSDDGQRSINMAVMRGFRLLAPEQLYNDRAADITNMDYDWVHQTLYWTDATYKAIKAMTLVSKHVITVVANLNKPASLAVDVGSRWLYWSSTGRSPSIERCGLDGGHRSVIINDMIRFPNDIAIDSSSKRLYWTDLSLQGIYSSDMDGSNRRQVIQTDGREHMKSISLFQNHIYWSDWKGSVIREAEKHSGERLKVMRTGRGAHYDIMVVHPALQPTGNNVCDGDNGGCSHICFPSSDAMSNVTCACPDKGYYQLSADKKHCLGSDF